MTYHCLHVLCIYDLNMIWIVESEINYIFILPHKWPIFLWVSLYAAYRVQLRLLFCHKESYVVKVFDSWIFSSPSLYSELIHSSFSLHHQMQFMIIFLRQSIRLLSTSRIIIWKFFSGEMDRYELMVKFQSDLKIISDCLDAWSSFCYFLEQEIYVEKLHQRDYSNLKLEVN